MVRHEVTGRADAPVVVLATPMAATLEVWQPQVEALAGRFRVVRYEYEGTPSSLDELGGAVVELLDALGIERASFCGLSLGGIVGMWLALNAPGRIDRLVLACTAAHLPPPSRWAERAALVNSVGTCAVIADAIVGRWLTPGYAERNPELVARLRAMVASMRPALHAGICAALEHMDLRDDLSRITAPTLVIAADHDEATPPDDVRWLAEEIVGARFELIADAAHLVNVQQPEAFNRLLLEHLPASRPAAR